PQKARAAAEQALKLDKNASEAGAVLAEVEATTSSSNREPPEQLVKTLTTIANGPNGQNEASARAIWYLAEILQRQLRALPADEIDQKVALIQQLEGLYTQASSMGSAEYAVASLWKLGVAYQQLAEAVESSPLPDGTSAADAQQIRAAIKQQVAPIKQR